MTDALLALGFLFTVILIALVMRVIENNRIWGHERSKLVKAGEVWRAGNQVESAPDVLPGLSFAQSEHVKKGWPL